MKSIAVFGATGRTGRPFTELALKAGYLVKALVRTPSKLGVQDSKLRIVEGDLTDAAKVEETIRGTEAVLLLVGMSPGARVPADIRETITRNVLAAMKNTGVKRIIRLANFAGSPDEKDKVGIGMRLMISMMNRNVLRDESASTDLIKQSNLDWTIVRNALILQSAPKGIFSAGNVGKGKLRSLRVIWQHSSCLS